MAHEIDMSNNRANMAFTGSRDKVWHGLGTELQQDASVDDWIVSAGLDWDVVPAEVQYTIPGTSANLFIPSIKTMADRKVLYRSDTKDSLAVVGKDFKVVQPRQVVEFFRDLVEKNNMKLSTAGSLFGGRKFWALAELGKDFEVVSGDKVTGHLMLTTAVDGSMKTVGKFVSTRVVCNNTLNIAMAEKGTRNVVQVSHRSEWDPDTVKVELGLMDGAWLQFIQDVRKLSATKVTDKKAYNFLSKVVFDKPTEPLTKVQERKIDNLMDLYKGQGMGADMATGTLWGVVNAITQQYTHGTGKRDTSHQFWDSEFSVYGKMKDRAFQQALAMV
jgi:phage/plasmid-like protein (TIGR03299 family)